MDQGANGRKVATPELPCTRIRNNIVPEEINEKFASSAHQGSSLHAHD
jgi:hypothetical protein